GLGCIDTAAISLYGDTLITSTLQKFKDTVCVNEPLYVKNIASNPLVGYLWSVDTGKIVFGDLTDSIGVSWNKSGYKTVIGYVLRDVCSIADSLEVYVLDFPSAHIELPQYTCVNQTVRMFPGPGAEKYYWTIDDHVINDTLFKESYNLTWNNLGR